MTKRIISFPEFLKNLQTQNNKIQYVRHHLDLVCRQNDIDAILNVMDALDDVHKAAFLIILGEERKTFFAKIAGTPEALYVLLEPLPPEQRANVLQSLDAHLYACLGDEEDLRWLDRLVPTKYFKTLYLTNDTFPMFRLTLESMRHHSTVMAVLRKGDARLLKSVQVDNAQGQHVRELRALCHHFPDLMVVLSLVSDAHKPRLLFALGEEVWRRCVKSAYHLANIFSILSVEHIESVFRALQDTLSTHVANPVFLSRIKKALTPDVLPHFMEHCKGLQSTLKRDVLNIHHRNFAPKLPNKPIERYVYLKQHADVIKKQCLSMPSLVKLLKLLYREYRGPLLIALGQDVLLRCVNNSAANLAEILNLITTDTVFSLFEKRSSPVLSRMPGALEKAWQNDEVGLQAFSLLKRYFNAPNGFILHEENYEAKLRCLKMLIMVGKCSNLAKMLLIMFDFKDFTPVLKSLEMGQLLKVMPDTRSLTSVLNILDEKDRFVFLKNFAVRLRPEQLTRYEQDRKLSELMQYYRSRVPTQPAAVRFFQPTPEECEISDLAMANSAFAQSWGISPK